MNSSFMYTTGPQGVGAAEGTVCGYGRVKNEYIFLSLSLSLGIFYLNVILFYFKDLSQESVCDA